MQLSLELTWTPGCYPTQGGDKLQSARTLHGMFQALIKRQEMDRQAGVVLPLRHLTQVVGEMDPAPTKVAILQYLGGLNQNLQLAGEKPKVQLGRMGGRIPRLLH